MCVCVCVCGGGGGGGGGGYVHACVCMCVCVCVFKVLHLTYIGILPTRLVINVPLTADKSKVGFLAARTV